MQVSGDVFLGRYFDNEEDFKRMDFTQADLSSAAPWVREARAQLMRRSERSGNTQQLMQQLRQQQPAASGGSAAKPQSPSEVEKNKGNEVGTNWKPRDEVQEPMLVMGSGSSS
jgi:hypothetical protein